MKSKIKKNQVKVRKNNTNDFFSFAEKNMSPQSLARAEAKAKIEVLNIRLGELREKIGLTQTNVPGFSQPSVSKLESREDLKISTLLHYLEGLNMDLEIIAHPRGNNKKDDEFELLNTGS
jgi:hypothetical protein